MGNPGTCTNGLTSTYYHMEYVHLTSHIGVRFSYVRMEENMKVPTKTYKCDPKNEQMFSVCVADYINKLLGCRLPWIKANTASSHPTCNSSRHFDKLADYFLTLGEKDSDIYNDFNKSGCQLLDVQRIKSLCMLKSSADCLVWKLIFANKLENIQFCEKFS